MRAFGFKPHNNLSGTKIAPPTEKRKPSVLSHSNHPAKRAKTESANTYTYGQFALQDSSPDRTHSTLRLLSTQGSIRSHNGEDKVHKTGVAEMRSIHHFTGDHNKRKRRHRHNKGGRLSMSRGSEESGDPIAEDSDNASPGTTAQWTGHLRQARALDPGDHAFVQPGRKPTQAQTYRRATGNYSADDIDELSPSFHPANNTTPEPNSGSGAKQATQSESLSTRGNIKSSFNQIVKGKKDIGYGGGVPLGACIWQPRFIYRADDYDNSTGEGCYFLRNCEGTGVHQVLGLFSDASDEAQPVLEDWFKLDARKINQVSSNKQHYLARVSLTPCVDKRTGTKLYLDFPGEIHLNRFLDWVRQNTTVTTAGIPDQDLPAEYAHQKQQTEQRASMKAACAAAAAASSSRAHQGPMDIRLMAKKADSRHEPQHNTNKCPPRDRSLFQMIDASQHSITPADSNGDDAARVQQSVQRRSTRQAPARAMDSVTPEPEIERWSETHPEWEKKWRMPLLYQRTTVEKDDIPRLDEDQCLNDNIIGFYLRYLYTELETHRPETARRIYFHNSFFYEKLKAAPRGAKINYQGVKNWTNKVDLFSYDYIVVPVNEHYHWWVAIICNPAKLDPDARQEDLDANSQSHGDADGCISENRGMTEGGEAAEPNVSAGQGHGEIVGGSQLEEPLVVSDIAPHDVDPAAAGGDDERGTARPVINLDEDSGGTATTLKPTTVTNRKGKRKSLARASPKKVNPADPRIITLDSLGSSHSPACTQLKLYLIAEFLDKKNKVVEQEKGIGTRASNLPEQNNFTDCGVYLLKYIAKFLEDPDKFIRAILLKEEPDWDIDSSKTRSEIRDLIFKLHGEYQEEQEKLKRGKITAKQRTKPQGRVDTKSSVPPASSAEAASAVAASSPTHERGRAQRLQSLPASSPTPRTKGVMQLDRREGQTLVDRPKSQQPEVKAKYSGKPKLAEEPVQAPHVDEDLDITPVQGTPRPVSDSHKPKKRPLPSIEIHDEDVVSVTPTQQRPRTNLRRVSPGQEIAVDESDSKAVQFVKASPVVKKRMRSESLAEISPDQSSVKRVQSAKLDSPDLGSSPPTRASDRELARHVVVSPYFGSINTPGVRSSPLLKKTYAARHRKTPSKEKHSVVKKTPSKENPGMTEATSPIDLTDD